jgi:D-amino-acid dehydrogenase
MLPDARPVQVDPGRGKGGLMRTLVLGGGVVGTATAFFLAEDGHEVTLLERRGDVALGTSFANGALIHASLVEPWNVPGIAFTLVRYLGREDAPAVLRLRALPGMVGWGLAFLRNSARARHARHTAINLRLAVYSARVLREVRAATGIAYDHGERGILKLYRDRNALERAATLAAALAREGSLPFAVLDRAGALALEPALAEIGEQIAGGVHFPEDESGDCHLFSRGLAERARGRGIEIRLDTAIERIDAEGGRVTGVLANGERLTADRYVLACGTGSAALGRPLGLRLPICPVKGYSLTAPRGGWNDAPRTPVSDDTLKIGVVPVGERLRIAGSAEFAGDDPSLNERRLEAIWTSATKLYPALARHLDRAAMQPWSGLRPMTPDGPPILGPTRYDNLFLNTGHGHLGWTMACGSARVVADLVSGRRPAIDLDGLTVDRFA